mmetsp:Transcript_40583/g.88383  ORF Transcript_40583/g.88383 Transcript_40583/m.88383 type:complete len:115 (+) Transcript_40583:1497-1841(+)
MTLLKLDDVPGTVAQVCPMPPMIGAAFHGCCLSCVSGFRHAVVRALRAPLNFPIAVACTTTCSAGPAAVSWFFFVASLSPLQFRGFAAPSWRGCAAEHRSCPVAVRRVSSHPFR